MSDSFTKSTLQMLAMMVILVGTVIFIATLPALINVFVNTMTGMVGLPNFPFVEFFEENGLIFVVFAVAVFIAIVGMLMKLNVVTINK